MLDAVIMHAIRNERPCLPHRSIIELYYLCVCVCGLYSHHWRSCTQKNAFRHRTLLMSAVWLHATQRLQNVCTISYFISFCHIKNAYFMWLMKRKLDESVVHMREERFQIVHNWMNERDDGMFLKRKKKTRHDEQYCSSGRFVGTCVSCSYDITNDSYIYIYQMLCAPEQKVFQYCMWICEKNCMFINRLGILRDP